MGARLQLPRVGLGRHKQSTNINDVTCAESRVGTVKVVNVNVASPVGRGWEGGKGVLTHSVT